MKYDINETFTDIDDKLIAKAKPVSQRPMELRPDPRSKSLVWKRAAAAAACLSVLAAMGGVIAAKVNLGSIVSGANSGAALSNDVNSRLDNIIESAGQSSAWSALAAPGDSDKTNNSNPFAGRELPESGMEEEFTYEGNLYKTISCGWSGSYSKNEDGLFLDGENEVSGAGARRYMADGVDTIELVAFVQNNSDSPLGLLGSKSSPDKPFLFRFDVDENLVDSHSVFDDEVFDTVAAFVQPGETYYQKVTFPVTEEKEYRLSTCVLYLDQKAYDESGVIEKNGGLISNRWVDFSDKSIAYDDIEKLFGMEEDDTKLTENSGSDGSDTKAPCEPAKEITYNGKVYNEVSSAYSGGYKNDQFINCDSTVLGARREEIDGVDTVEFVIRIKNEGTLPLAVLGSESDPESAVLVENLSYDEVTRYTEYNLFKDVEFTREVCVLQPGESYYETFSFPVTDKTMFYFYSETSSVGDSFKTYSGTSTLSCDLWVQDLGR